MDVYTVMTLTQAIIRIRSVLGIYKFTEDPNLSQTNAFYVLKNNKYLEHA